MANKKISQLPLTTTPSDIGVLPIVQGGATEQTTAANLITRAHGLGFDAVPVIDSAGVMTPLPTNVTPGYVLTSDGLTASFQPPSGGGGQIIYDAIVAPSGGDYTTLSAALAAASNGWNIFIRPGTYVEAGFSSNATDITIVGSGQVNTTLDFTLSNGSFDFSTSTQGWNISELKINLGTGSFNAAGYGCTFNNISIYQQGIIAGSQAFGLGTYVSTYNNVTFLHANAGPDAAPRIVVSNGPNAFNECSFTLSLDGLGVGADAISIPNASNISFNDCSFQSSYGSGVGCNVLFHNNGTNLTVNNCDFYNVTDSDDYCIYDNNAENARFIGNRFKGYGFAIYVQSGQGDCNIDSNQITTPSTTGIGIDVDYTIGTIITSNKITLGGGTSTGIRLWNAGNNHSLDNNVIDNVGTGILVDTGVIDVMLGTNNIFNATTAIDNLGTGTNIINRQNYDAVVAPSGGDFTTLGAAVAAASNDWRILVKPGTYTEGAITSALTGLTIEGSGNGSTILNITSNVINFTGNNLTINNLKFNGTTGLVWLAADYINTNGMFVELSGLPSVVSHLWLQGNYHNHYNLHYKDSTTTSYNGYKFRFQADRSVIDGALFELNLDNTNTYEDGFSILGTRSTITNSRFVKLLGSGDLDCCISIGGTYSSVTNCTFVGTDNANAGVVMLQPGCLIEGNTFVGFMNSIISYTGSTGYPTRIANNGITTGGTYNKGIWLSSNSNYVTVSDNHIYTTTGSNNYGIYVSNNSSNNHIADNQVVSLNGVWINAAGDANNAIVGNYLRTSTTPITDNGTSTFSSSNCV